MRCPTPRYVWPTGRIIAVPCGKCLACLSNKRKDWSFRLMQEFKVSQSAHFVTLTYHDKYYPKCGVVKKHLQLYFKRLRKRSPAIRYYAVAEYGSKNGRGHYHAIIFNAEEETIRKSWCWYHKKSDQWYMFGIVHVGNVTEASVAYVTKYIVQKGSPVDDLNAPFCIMSRGYGLGLNYLTDEMVSWHRADDRVYAVQHGQKVRLPRYYKEKIWPNADWSDWKTRREKVNEKALKEAEEKDKRENEMLKAHGIKDPEAYRSMARRYEIGRTKTKVKHSQKF